MNRIFKYLIIFYVAVAITDIGWYAYEFIRCPVSEHNIVKAIYLPVLYGFTWPLDIILQAQIGFHPLKMC